MYFQQAAGEDLRLKYVRGRYGPYAENLNHVLALEGHFLRGYGDRSRKVHESGALEVLPDAADEANAFLAGRADTTDRIGEVLNLVRGFESPYELELLSSVHWVATQDDHRAVEEVDCAVQGVQGWSRQGTSIHRVSPRGRLEPPTRTRRRRQERRVIGPELGRVGPALRHARRGQHRL